MRKIVNVEQTIKLRGSVCLSDIFIRLFCWHFFGSFFEQVRVNMKFSPREMFVDRVNNLEIYQRILSIILSLKRRHNEGE